MRQNQQLNLRRSKREMKKRTKRNANKGLNRNNALAYRMFKKRRRSMFEKDMVLTWPTVWRGLISAFRTGKFI